MWNSIISFFMSIALFILNIFGLGHLLDSGYNEYKNLSYGQYERNVMDLYLPEKTGDTTGLILFIHGGAWIGGDKSSYTDTAKDVCKKYKIAAATINYRYLSETVTMADIIDDIDAAVTKIKETGKENSTDINKMILTGHSAGGHLSMLYAYAKAETAAITPAAVTNYCGPTDLNDPNFLTESELGTDNVLLLLSYATGKSVTAENIGSFKAEIDAVSPLTYVSESTVPTIINHGMKDTIVPYSNAVSLDTKMTQYGVTHIFNTYPNSGHGLDSDKSNDEYAASLTVQYLNEYVLK